MPKGGQHSSSCWIGPAARSQAFATSCSRAMRWRAQRSSSHRAEDIHGSAEPAVIARGRYLVTGPAYCTACHGQLDPTTKSPVLETEPPLIGGLAFRPPIGTIYARNITPDTATGIGRYTDPEIAGV